MTDPIAASREAEGVRRARPDEIPALAAVITAAFENDPVQEWFLPTAHRRRERIERSTALFLRRLWMRFGECYATPRVAGAAFWVPPDEAELSTLDQLRLAAPMARVLGRDLRRYLRGIALMERFHPEERHWYLPLLGVDPAWQGRGLGSALLRPVLERCDRDRVPAYLEASTERNRRLYERHGFEFVGTIELPGGPPLWRMWREPSGSG